MSRPESPLPDRPESPGTVRSAPISEPAWLKKAQTALNEDTSDPPPTIPETPVDESVEHTEHEVQPSSETVEYAQPPPAPYSISDLNDQVQKLVERIEKLESTGPVVDTTPENTDESVSTETTNITAPIVVSGPKKEETRLILASKSGRSYLPVSRNIFSSIYNRRRNN